MTDKTETALDLDGLDLARPPWRYCDQTQTIFGNSDKGEHYVAMIRGWGHYTGNGHGALGLPSDVAIEVQQAIGLRISKLPELEALVAAKDARIRELENRLHPTHISMDDDFYTQSDNVADAMDGVFDAAGPHKIYRAVTIGLPSTYGCWINGHAVEFKTEDEAKKALKETS